MHTKSVFASVGDDRMLLLYHPYAQNPTPSISNPATRPPAPPSPQRLP